MCKTHDLSDKAQQQKQQQLQVPIDAIFLMLHKSNMMKISNFGCWTQNTYFAAAE